MTTGTNGAGSAASAGVGQRWRTGDHILWRYRANGPANGTAAFHICRPVTVVEDTPDLLAVWLAGDTECVKPTLTDGTPIHLEPLATRYTKPRTTVRAPWTGTGVLKLARPGDPWSVWLFWDLHWRFKNWYVNLEEPRRRWPGGVDSEDHFLDIAVYPDRSWEWRDEDEFAQAQQAGLLDAEQAARVRDAGEAAIRLISTWGWPFSEKWTRWRPDPGWLIPRLPADWNRPAPDSGGHHPPQRWAGRPSTPSTS
ncbi:cytidylyl-2-hydroxypropylphosphonate hydrolase [Streptomyces sp. 6N223]|uniref:cytidylyl-2-hydroxypropylphosphonate hydrolase n=1 Tax=Streptomyces sp. 6N223 TaxID=3457412 RepID=UPI003FD318FC